MGCCLGRDRGSFDEDNDDGITIGKNRPLCQDKLKWKSDVPMTEGQLRSKRDEFWETAPAFEGRKEIWDALRAASSHAEQGDYALAQAIVDGANISLPDGTLRESYDELGNRYQVPVYCLSSPLNLVEERSESSAHQSDLVEPSSTGGGGGANSNSTGPPDGKGELSTVKFRLSTNSEDIKMDVRSQETVYQVKTRLHKTSSPSIPPANQQRWFFGGRVLLDKMRIEECSIPANFVVQVVVSSRPYAAGQQQQLQNNSPSVSERSSSRKSNSGRRHRQQQQRPNSNGQQQQQMVALPPDDDGGGRRSKQHNNKHHRHHRTRSRNSTGSNTSTTNNNGGNINNVNNSTTTATSNGNGGQSQKRRNSTSATSTMAAANPDSPPPVETR